MTTATANAIQSNSPTGEDLRKEVIALQSRIDSVVKVVSRMFPVQEPPKKQIFMASAHNVGPELHMERLSKGIVDIEMLNIALLDDEKDGRIDRHWVAKLRQWVIKKKLRTRPGTIICIDAEGAWRERSLDPETRDETVADLVQVAQELKSLVPQCRLSLYGMPSAHPERSPILTDAWLPVLQLMDLLTPKFYLDGDGSFERAMERLANQIGVVQAEAAELGDMPVLALLNYRWNQNDRINGGTKLSGLQLETYIKAILDAGFDGIGWWSRYAGWLNRIKEGNTENMADDLVLAILSEVDIDSIDDTQAFADAECEVVYQITRECIIEWGQAA